MSAAYTITELASQIEKACTVAERLESIEQQLRGIRSTIEAIPRGVSAPNEAPKILFTLVEAANALSVCKATVRQLVRQGYIPTKTIGRLVRIHKADIEKLAKIGVPSVWSDKPWPDDRATARFQKQRAETAKGDIR